MERRRVLDMLIGAAIACAAMLLATVALLWWMTDPVSELSRAEPPSRVVEPGAVDAPADLAPGETWLGDFVLDAEAMATSDALLRDVHATGQDARTGPDGTTAGRLAVDVTVPFEVVAEQIGGGTTLRPAADGPGATLVRTVEIAGRRLRVAATGTVDVKEGQLAIVPRSIDLGGPESLSRGLAAVVRRLVTIEEPVQGLPDGLVLEDVTVGDDGLRARLRGQDVVLAPAAGD